MSLKVFFTDFWPGFEKQNHLLDFLSKRFDVTLDRNPDYLFYSLYGNEHFNYRDCIKILFSGENIVPDFNISDYAIGCHYIDFNDRYLRFPEYILYEWYYSNYLGIDCTRNKVYQTNDAQLMDRKFCNFIYSNSTNSDPLRDLFFKRLSQYKQVDSGGMHLNNIGYKVVDKLSFINQYKFTIAFENSAVPGYTTEKLLDPIIMESLPIYYGDPLVHYDFNIDSFVRVSGYDDIERAVDEIIFLDTNPDAYIEMLRRAKFTHENTLEKWEKRLNDFLCNIFNQTLSDSHRCSMYGFSKLYCTAMQHKSYQAENTSDEKRLLGSIRIFLNRLLMSGKRT